jgi:Rha family phage regulatory protein
MTQLVFVENGRIVTNSLVVAEEFQKEHRNVLADIENQITKLSEAGLGEWGVLNFQRTHYQHTQNKQWYPKIDMTEEAFAIVAMSYVTPEAMKMKVKFLDEFKRMRNALTINTQNLSPELQMFNQMFQAVAKVELENAENNKRIAEVQNKVTTIQETILQRDDNWRAKITGMLNGAAQKFGGHKEIRTESYSRLEERAHCKLNTRLANLKDRLEESGATKTKIEKANRLDVIEADPKLKEIYSIIVKELSIGSMV